MLAWDDLKVEFAWDGSLRDICVIDTSIADWRSALEMIHAGGYRLVFTIDGVEATAPDNLHQIFGQPRECSFLLAAFVDGVQLNCHFFSESEIEFDLDPREVTDQADLAAILGFMRMLAQVAAKPALLTPENMQDFPILTCQPDGGVVHHPRPAAG